MSIFACLTDFETLKRSHENCKDVAIFKFKNTVICYLEFEKLKFSSVD